MMDLSARMLEDELMDQPGIDAQTHINALCGIGRVNWISGINGLLWRELKKFQEEAESESLRVLDMACGGGDVLIRLAQRAQCNGLAIQFAGSDISETAVEYAQWKAKFLKLDNLQFFCHDALHDPLTSTYDVVMSSLFLHHLTDHQAIILLRRMSEIATRGILLDDLQRSTIGYVLAWCGVRLLTRSAMVHFDGPVSVKAAFQVDEVRRLAAEAGLGSVQIRRHWPQRFLLRWTPQPEMAVQS